VVVEADRIRSHTVLDTTGVERVNKSDELSPLLKQPDVDIRAARRDKTALQNFNNIIHARGPRAEDELRRLFHEIGAGKDDRIHLLGVNISIS
jgi:hypothetical protein